MLQKNASYLSKNGLLPTPPLPNELDTIELSQNSQQVLVRRYVRRGKDGKPVETPQEMFWRCLLYTSPSPRDRQKSRMPSSA
jgi:ribonucleoside-diphosphate reductase alpha chain